VSVALGTVLLTTGTTAIAVEPAEGSAPSAVTTSPADAPRPSEADIRAADFAWAARHSKGGIPWALTQAKRTGKKTLVPDETTATTLTHANPDGSLTSEVTAGPARVRQGGKWVDVDAGLTTAADGTVRAKAHPNGLELSGGGGVPAKSLRAAGAAPARDLVTLGEGNERVTLQWKGGLPKPDLHGTRATYREALPGADVIIEATRTGFEQYVKLRQRPTGSYSYTLPLKAEGLTAAEQKDGSVLFTDTKTGARRAAMPAPVMWDASVDSVSGKHENRHPVDMEVIDRGNGDVDLVVTPDQAWLADPATRYPVTVDPSTSVLTNVFDTYVQQGETVDLSTDIELDLGNPGTTNPDGTPRTARSFITWNTAPFRDALVTNADVSLWNFHSGNTDCKAYAWTVWDTTAASTSSRWTRQPTWQQQYHSSTQTKGNPSCTAAPDGWISADVTTLVQTWSSALDTRGHMGLRAATDDVRAWKRVNSANATANPPKLTVTWNYRPGDGTAQQAGAPFKSYAGVWAVNTTTPVLRDKFTDADGDRVNGTFQVYDAATNLPITTPAGDGVIVSPFVAPGAWASVTVPAGQLVNGKTYKFRTNAYDGTHYNLNWSPWREFVVDTTAPGAPKSITSTTYPEDLPGGGIGEQGRFDVETGATDVREVQYRIGPADTDDDGNSGNTSPDGWLTTPATARSLYASFSAAPATNGSHQAEVRSVDRADNTGPARVYGFASPRRTDTGRAKKVDIDLPKPNIGAPAPAFRDEPQPAWEWVTVQRNGAITDGKPLVRSSVGPHGRSTVTLTPLAELKRTKADIEQIRRQHRLPSYPDPIIKGAWCDPTLVNIPSRMTRTEACLPMQVMYEHVDSGSRPPKVYQQAFDVLYMIKVDPDGNKIKTWMQMDPRDWSIPFPKLPFPGGANGKILLDVQSWCQSDGCNQQQQNWDFYGGQTEWNGNQDQHIITGIADFDWNGNVNNASGGKDNDLSKTLPLRWWMDWGTTVPGIPDPSAPDKIVSPQLTARCDKVVSGRASGCVLPAYKPGYTINSEAFPGVSAHIWLIQNKHAKKLGQSPLTPLHYLPSKARNAPGQETENKLDNGRPGNRKAVCGRQFRKHPDTATIATPSGNADPKSCDEFPFAASYESPGFPAARGGLNPAQNIEHAGLECVQTVVAKGSATREHLYNDTTYDDPTWPALCGRSSMSNYVNTQSMQPFGVKFAKEFRMLDYDEYWVDPANSRFASCDPNLEVVKCTMN
jgi:hypothetical protein